MVTSPHSSSYCALIRRVAVSLPSSLRRGFSHSLCAPFLPLTIISYPPRNTSNHRLRCTNLKDLVAGEKVNLERAMAGNARNSGHNVQGHVDEAGRIKRFRREGESLWVYIEASAELLKSIVPKGYIAVDGTSLTVCEVNYTEGWFNLMLIPHTQNNIIMPTKKVGALVNLEPDVIAKYVQRVVESVGSGAAHAELVQRLGAVERAAAQGARRLVLGVAVGAAVGALIGAFVTKRA